MKYFKKIVATVAVFVSALFGYRSTIKETTTIESRKEYDTPVKIDLKSNSRISINCDSTCTPDEKNALNRIVDKMVAIEASDCFSSYIKEPSTMLDAGQLNMLTIDQAIKKVITSRVNTTLTYYYQSRNWFTKTLVIGYENGDGKIHANRAAWDYMSDCEKASNLAHEISHQLGFHHDFERTARRPYSLPYVIGDAVLECCK